MHSHGGMTINHYVAPAVSGNMVRRIVDGLPLSQLRLSQMDEGPQDHSDSSLPPR